MKKDLRNAIEANGWTIDDEGNTIRIAQSSPAGEDFSFTIAKGSDRQMRNDIRTYAEDFDIGDHTDMWIEARHSGTAGVPGTKDLIEDAQAIKKLLETLAEAMNRSGKYHKCEKEYFYEPPYLYRELKTAVLAPLLYPKGSKDRRFRELHLKHIEDEILGEYPKEIRR